MKVKRNIKLTASRSLRVAAVLFVAVSVARPAHAHLTGVRAALVPDPSSTSSLILSGRGEIRFRPERGGRLVLTLVGVSDVSGVPANATGNALEIGLVVQGASASLSVPFDIKNGRGKAVAMLGLTNGDLVEVRKVELIDSGGARFACLGVVVVAGPSRSPVRGLGAALIPGFGTPSPIQLSPGRDADVTLARGDGALLKARADSVRDRISGDFASAANNRLELETAVGGAAPVLYTFPFELADGEFKLVASLGLAPGDIVAIQRIDLFDSSGDRFATLGFKVSSPAP